MRGAMALLNHACGGEAPLVLGGQVLQQRLLLQPRVGGIRIEQRLLLPRVVEVDLLAPRRRRPLIGPCDMWRWPCRRWD